MSSTSFATRTEIESRFQHMKRRKHIFVWMACGLVLVAALAAGITWAVRRDRAMHAALRELQEWNQADTVFTSDSVARMLVDHFDHPWHRANDRMLAHYLLGRAHADMGEAPQAIEDYQTAVECADTTDKDCDYRLLRNVYGQMAEVFDAQNLPEDELLAQKRFNHYSWMIGDTLQAINGFRRLERPLYLLGQYQQILQNNALARQKLIEHGDSVGAAQALITPSYIHIINHDYKRAYKDIVTVRKQANIFDEQGRLLAGNEMYYYTLGFYFDNVNELDSAEYYYRRALASNKYEAGYKGLLSVYSKRGIADSIAKFAPLYADANDAMHRKMNSDMVHQTNAQYQYARHQRLARQFEQQASRRLRVILIILCFLFLSAYLFYRHHRHVQKNLQEKENHLLNLRLQLMSVNDSLRHLQQKATTQEQELTFYHEQIDDLSQQKTWLEEQLMSNDDRYKTFYDNAIVKRFRLMALPSNKMYSSAYEREQLVNLFKSCFPAFAKSVQNLNLKDKEWMVIVLTELGFQTGDMLMAARMDGNSVTMIKRSLSRKLFGLDGLSTFHIALQSAIVTGRLQN